MAVAIVRTANPAGANAASNVATYSTVSIGTASNDRIIVVVVGTELASSTPSACTIDYGSGDVEMTAGNTGNFGAMFARTFRLPVPTGTTATIKVTFSSTNPTSVQNNIAVYAVTGANYLSAGNNGSTDMDATSPLTTGSITIPSGGGFLAVAAGAADAVAKTWTNATEDLDLDAGDFRMTTATRTTSGTVTVTCAGGTNNEDGAMSWLIFADGYIPSVSDTITVTESVSVVRNLAISVNDAVTVTDSTGSDTYYFDASDGGPTDPNGAWSDDANAFDGSTSTSAQTFANGTTSTNYLLGEGTNAPASGGVISQVRARHYDSNGSSSSGLNRRAYIYTDGLGELLGNTDRDAASVAGYSSYVTLSTPTGGWTWEKLQALETKLVATSGADSAASFYRVEIAVSAASIVIESPPTNPQPSVNDSVTIADVPTIVIPTLKPSINDAITLTEDVQVRVNAHPNVNDSITVTESVSGQVVTNISVFDAITVEDFPGYHSDTVYITEQVTARVNVLPSVNDSITVTDVPTITIGNHVPSVNDTVTVTESVTITVNALPSVNDAITVTENLQFTGTSYPSVNDTVTIAEVISTDVRSYISVNDAVSITENVALTINTEVADLSLSVNDAITVTESVTLLLTSYPSISDSVSVAEAVTIVIPTLVPSVSDTITVVDAPSVSIRVTPSVSDTITVTEANTFTGTSQFSVNDTVTVAEDVTLRLTSYPSVSDTVTVSESVTLQINTQISVFDAVTVEESPNISVINPGAVSINVSDSVTVNESVTVVRIGGRSGQRLLMRVGT